MFLEKMAVDGRRGNSIKAANGEAVTVEGIKRLQIYNLLKQWRASSDRSPLQLPHSAFLKFLQSLHPILLEKGGRDVFYENIAQRNRLLMN